MRSKNSPIGVSLGIFCYNEAKNIGKLLNSIQKQRTEMVNIREILVISSGSFDKTNEIVNEYAKKNKLIKLVIQLSRQGKSSAINEFLTKARSNVLIIISGDIRLHSQAIEEIALPFLHKEVGMVGAHPIPVNLTNNNWAKEIKLLWYLHHLVSLESPKCGEMVAFRNVLKSIPYESAVDEATIEVLMHLVGYKVVYAPRSIVFNKGPNNLSDFIKQRRRIYAGHLWVKQNYHYQVSTLKTISSAKILRNYLINNPKDWYVVFRLIVIEVISRVLGWIDYVLLKRNPFVWDMIQK